MGPFRIGGVLNGETLHQVLGEAMDPEADLRVWFVALDDGQHGPYTDAEIQEWLVEERLTPEHLCWKEGLPGWLPLAELPEFAAYGARAPRVDPVPKSGFNLPKEYRPLLIGGASVLGLLIFGLIIALSLSSGGDSDQSASNLEDADRQAPRPTDQTDDVEPQRPGQDGGAPTPLPGGEDTTPEPVDPALTEAQREAERIERERIEAIGKRLWNACQMPAWDAPFIDLANARRTFVRAREEAAAEPALVDLVVHIDTCLGQLDLLERPERRFFIKGHSSISSRESAMRAGSQVSLTIVDMLDGYQQRVRAGEDIRGYTLVSVADDYRSALIEREYKRFTIVKGW